MLTLDKVQLLEERIKKAVTLIKKLRDENAALRDELDMLKIHNDELKDFAKSLGTDNQLIEESIASALEDLEKVSEPIEKDSPSPVTPAEKKTTAKKEEEPAVQSSSPVEAQPDSVSTDEVQSTDHDDLLINLGPDDEDIPLY